jgi:hypothetical protein
MVTIQGNSKLDWPWFYCTHYSLGFCPLDEGLEISRKQHQFEIQKKTVILLADVTFARKNRNRAASQPTAHRNLDRNAVRATLGFGGKSKDFS